VSYTINRKKKFSAGFALFEMVVVIMIISLIALIAFPRIIGAIDSIRVATAAHKMANDIRYVRELALSNHETYGLTFSATGNSYTVFELNGSTKTTVTDPYTSKPMVIDFDDIPEYDGVAMGSVSMCVGTCTNQELRIDAFGNPFDENNAAFTTLGSVAVQLGSHTRTIQVMPETSFTKVI
jgi:prepilin-type N-terminal cleavage/methylation domain-containing protein